jgi:hypothetical protein
LIGQLEAEVAETEAEIKSVESMLSAPPPGVDIFSLSVDHQQLTEILQGKLAAWEENSERLEELQALQGQSVG